MKITKLRTKNDKKLTTIMLNNLCMRLRTTLARKGFITDVVILNGSSLNISNNGCSFNIDVNKLGYNARINQCTIIACKAGFKRTNTPTWTQRESFNHTINDVLDKYKFKGNIKSGEYTVRDFDTGRYNKWNLPETYHTEFGLRVPSLLQIVPIQYANDAVEGYAVYSPFSAVPEGK